MSKRFCTICLEDYDIAESRRCDVCGVAGCSGCIDEDGDGFQRCAKGCGNPKLPADDGQLMVKCSGCDVEIDEDSCERCESCLDPVCSMCITDGCCPDCEREYQVS